MKFGWRRFNPLDESTYPTPRTWVLVTNYGFIPVYAARQYFGDKKFHHSDNNVIKQSEITHWSYIEKVTDDLI
jgi:hypothetical protein